MKKEFNVAFVPVRGGSKSIPKKNIKIIGGKPLVYWVLNAIEQCKYIDCTYVSTDDNDIKNIVESFAFNKVKVINRSAVTSTDEATTESVMLEFASFYDFDNVVLVQATSPLLEAKDLNNGFKEFFKQDVDSVLSVVRQKRFIWEKNENGTAKPCNYDIFARPRRQVFEGFLVENGAFYITSKRELVRSKNRISGNIHVIEMDENSYNELDEINDWKIVENLLLDRSNS